MFRAVRNWWQRGRGKVTARLFVFELTVVMIGVLAAQQVSSWALRRNSINQIDGLYADQRDAFGVYRQIAETYLAAIPCYRERTDQLFRTAADDAPVDPALLGFAPFAAMGPDDITTDQYQLLGDRYGDKVRTKVGSMQFNLQEVQTEVAALNQVWFDFDRLDASGGRVSESDRAAARAAAVQVRGLLARLEDNSQLIRQIANELGVPRKPHPGITPVANCDEMWRLGRAYHDRDRPFRQLAKPGVAR